MEIRSHRLGFIAVAWGLGLLHVIAACAQSPAGREVLANPSHLPGQQFPSDLACHRSGLCVVLWDYGIFSADSPPVFQGVRLGATTLSPANKVLNERIYAEDRFAVAPLVTRVEERFAVFWNQTVTQGSEFRSHPVLQWFGLGLEPQGGVIDLPPAGGAVRDVARIPGGFVQLVEGHDVPLPDSSPGVFLSFVDDAGRELRPVVRVNPEVAGEQYPGLRGLAVALGAGLITVGYDQFFRDIEDPETDVFYRRFSLAGEPLTPAVRMNSYLADSQGGPAIATAPNGGFTAVWVSQEQDGSYAGIFGRRFSADGAPLGPDFQINQVTFSDQTLPAIARDPAGNFVVVWQTYDPSSFGVYAWDIKARLYRADGRPVGPEVLVNQDRYNSQEFPLLAFAPNGTYVVAWSSNGQVPPHSTNFTDIFARRFAASLADEPCLVGGGKFRCDTGRTGGELEVKHNFGGGGSGWGFLGDLDGDGREDPCVYTGGTFRCDTDHEGGAAEAQIAFAVPGAAVPLLGDVDGDGRADPCLAGVGAIHCDTRHDGGTAEVRIVFGQPGETLLLGDLNGDKRAEACAFAGGLFRCDTAHNGGKPELLLKFGRRGDQPLLGDFDGDGRDDPCVFRRGMLLCDMAHDGGEAEGTLSLGNAKDRVVLGNLDGL